MNRGRYASGTDVTVDRKKAEIEHILTRYGADAFMYGWEGTSALIGFRYSGKMVRFMLPLPDRESDEFHLTPSGQRRRTADAAEKVYQQAVRQRWRALALIVKAKLEATEAGVTTFVVPSEYGGVMVTDRGRSYDAQALSGVKQQKCLAHVLRSISEVVQTKRGRGRTPDRSRGHGFGKRLSGLLREAMELRQSYRRGEASDYVAETERLRREVSYHLRDRPMPDRDNGRLQNELGWHDDRGNLLRFLDDPGIEPTNNRAERALRGAVIARKVSHCSKNEDGADAFSAFTSVIRTLARKGGDQPLVDGLCGVFSGAPVHARST